MIARSDFLWVADKLIALSLLVNESSIPTFVIESSSVANTTLIVSTQVADTEIPIIEDILVFIVVSHYISLTSRMHLF